MYVDPIYTFNAALYDGTKEQAQRLGLSMLLTPDASLPYWGYPSPDTDDDGKPMIPYRAEFVEVPPEHYVIYNNMGRITNHMEATAFKAKYVLMDSQPRFQNKDWPAYATMHNPPDTPAPRQRTMLV